MSVNLENILSRVKKLSAAYSALKEENSLLKKEIQDSISKAPSNSTSQAQQAQEIDSALTKIDLLIKKLSQNE